MTREDEELQPRRGRGRPKQDDTYDYVLKVRLSEEDLYRLKNLEGELGMSRAEIMRKALETFHNIKIRWG